MHSMHNKHSVLLPERFGFCLAPSAHNSMCSPESPLLFGPNRSEKHHWYLHAFIIHTLPDKVNTVSGKILQYLYIK